MAKQRTPKPDANYVYSLYELRRSSGDETRIRWIIEMMRPLVRMQHVLNVPDAYKQIAKTIRTPFVRDTLMRTTTALNQKPYTIEIEPRDERQVSARAAELGIRWDTALREVLDKEIGENAAIESTKALIRDGESVLKVVHRPDAWASFPEREADEEAEAYSGRADRYKKGQPVPFAWRVVDRLSMLFGDGEFGDDWALEYGEYPRTYLGQQYRMVETNEGLKDPKRLLGGKPKPQGYLYSNTGRTVKLEYWDADWWHVVIDGEDAPGFPKKNPYSPRIPYFRAKAPDSESLLYSLLWLAPALDEVLTMKANWAYLSAYPNPRMQQVPNAITMSPTGEDGQPTTLSWKPGKAIQVPVGWNLDFLAPPPAGKDLNDLVVLLRDLIDVAGIPSVFRGAGGDNQAGYAINQLIAAASLAFKLAGEALARQFERAFEFFHWMVAHIVDQPVPLLAGPGADGTGKQWLALRPGNGCTTTEAGIEDLGPVTVTFRPTLPTDEQALAMIATQLVNSPKQLLSRRTAMKEYLHLDDPDSELDEIAVEMAMESPPLQQKVMEEALQKAGLASPQAPASPAAAPPGPSGPPAPGQVAGGPSVPGLTMPMQPPPPQAPPIHPGRPGMFPGAPATPTSTAGG